MKMYEIIRGRTILNILEYAKLRDLLSLSFKRYHFTVNVGSMSTSNHYLPMVVCRKLVIGSILMVLFEKPFM